MSVKTGANYTIKHLTGAITRLHYEPCNGRYKMDVSVYGSDGYYLAGESWSKPGVEMGSIDIWLNSFRRKGNEVTRD